MFSVGLFFFFAMGGDGGFEYLHVVPLARRLRVSSIDEVFKARLVNIPSLFMLIVYFLYLEMTWFFWHD
jgi:hypothetical protein